MTLAVLLPADATDEQWRELLACSDVPPLAPTRRYSGSDIVVFDMDAPEAEPFLRIRPDGVRA